MPSAASSLCSVQRCASHPSCKAVGCGAAHTSPPLQRMLQSTLSQPCNGNAAAFPSTTSPQPMSHAVMWHALPMHSKRMTLHARLRRCAHRTPPAACDVAGPGPLRKIHSIPYLPLQDPPSYACPCRDLTPYLPRPVPLQGRGWASVAWAANEQWVIR